MKTERIEIRIDKYLKMRLQEYAQDGNLTMSQVVENAIKKEVGYVLTEHERNV